MYSNSTSESPGRSIPDMSDDESVISKSISMTKFSEDEESVQSWQRPLEVTNSNDSYS